MIVRQIFVSGEKLKIKYLINKIQEIHLFEKQMQSMEKLFFRSTSMMNIIDFNLERYKLGFVHAVAVALTFVAAYPNFVFDSHYL